MRSLVRFGAGAFGVQLVTYLSTNVDNVILGRFAGAVNTGYYARAFQLFRLPAQQIATPIGQVALPVLSRLQQDQLKFDAYFERAHLAMLYTFGGLSFAMASCSWPIVDVALGPGWGPAKPVFAILALGGVFQSMTYAYMWAFQSRGLVGLQLKYAIIGRTLMIGLLFAGLPFGTIGVAIGSAAGQLLMWGLYTTFAVDKFGFSRARIVRLVLGPTVVGAVAAVFAGVISLITGEFPPILHLLVSLVAFAVVWLSSAAAIAPVRRDLGALWATVLRLFRRRAAVV
jgi:PST family polysaccharide transporter